MRNPVWYPLRAAVALLVSHDEAFARTVSQQEANKSLPFQAALPGTLLNAMEADGALVLANVGVRSTPRGEQPRFDFIPNETYQGRFDSVLRNFRQQDSSFEDFVVARMEDAGRELGLWISEGWLSARDCDGTICSATAATLRLGSEVEFENGPPYLIMLDAASRRRRHVMVNWPQLLECFFGRLDHENNALPATRSDAKGPLDGTHRPDPTAQRDQAPVALVTVSGQAIEGRTCSWKPTWLSLPSGIMWAVTRDMALTKSIDQRPNNDHGMLLGISVALAMEQHETGKPVDQRIDLHEAWPAIRSLIGDEKIMTEGRSILREGLIGAIERRLPNMAIPSGDAGNLFISSSVAGIEPKDALAPDEPYRFHNGQGRYWYDVRLCAADVFREYPADRETFSADDIQQIGHKKRRGGRRKGSGSYERFDKPLIDEMQILIDEGKAVSPEAASHLVAHKAEGGGTKESKAERLAKRYRASRDFDRNNSD
jgi:hypothetical protein